VLAVDNITLCNWATFYVGLSIFYNTITRIESADVCADLFADIFYMCRVNDAIPFPNWDSTKGFCS
jgi:hypothetical protein